ncbi:MAG: triose-phosphate isomerase [Candidatus Zambryskibacteria bacterium CG_4_9_14_3_um_filter_42_9]|uniref:Triosephosphate isomerase n=1 Tax=Candidatus Zambryskibacteria bacterium CG22_combo_CG10-13_8_21_14_all_42_17 TaxID=1975118 RepID=A0A2H0BDD5_9BACT|nr:MAG: triose-phosphate isomerase [Candidatus Zambryskibacteria bacterium CG22_combo_CG10-13_8_21_14_all_42_17]PJA36609.1 MAG: triose-phosphate isomerase [Candidatus Zambryskibacteria bacterium CG_4_9_14_3_um_filter_42_9]
MAKPILVANWKNHPSSPSEAKTLLKHIAKSAKLYKKFSFFIAPPFPYFESVSECIRNFGQLAAQNMSNLSFGTYTGQVTPDILKGFGVRLVILGHSECRVLGETNEMVAEKLKIALNAGITPLVCVGEASRDQDGEYFEFLRQQLKFSLSGLNAKTDISKVVLAYEPVWAIGKRAQDAITPDDLAQTVIFIKKVLTDIFGRELAERVPILYGGSVEPVNASVLAAGTGIKGFLVGHASLDAKSFQDVAKSLIFK